ncbi:EF-hand domain-containing protein [Streptomyces sp. NPDC004126]|uniref:EF-hand domain-containing protein n=1 Tax=Streptomyces sp. NPDC004126 TaxID=3390695 RepID=UPI003D055F62
MLGTVQRTNMNRMFDTIDVSGDGVISKADFEIMAQRVRGMSPSMDADLAAEIDDAFDAWWEAIRVAADADGNGEVSREEFVAAIENGLENDADYGDTMVRHAELTFRAADEDGDGRLTPVEMERIYRAFGLNEQFSEDVFARIDLDGDGYVSVDECVRATRDLYSSNDPQSPGAIVYGPHN